MSIVPSSAGVAALLPAVANFLLEPQVARAIGRETSKFITESAAKDPSGAIMSRASAKMGMGKAGYVMPVNNTKMLKGNTVVDYSGSSSTPVVTRSASASYPIGYNGAPTRRGRRSRRLRVPRGLSSYVDKIQTCFRASPALANTALNGAGYAYSLAVATNNSGIGLGPLSLFVTQWTALASIYREFRINRICVDWVPRVGSTTAGEVSCAIDRDPRTGITGIQAIVRRNPFFQTDIKLPAALEWKPVDSKDTEWRYTALAGLGGSRPEETLSFGVLLLSSNNDLANGATIGDLFINVWAEFAVPI